MNDKEFKAEQKRVSTVVRRWIEILGLRKDRFSFEWHRLPNTECPQAVADCTASWEYRNHHINVYLPESLKLKDDELQECLVHELSHVLLSPLWDGVQDKSKHEIEKNEYATTSVTFAILWAYEEGKK